MFIEIITIKLLPKFNKIKENLNMISNIDESRVIETAKFLDRLTQINSRKSKFFPSGFDEILSTLRKRLKKSNNEVLIYTENNNILGVLVLYIEKNEKYLEEMGGVFANERYKEISIEFFKYLQGQYKGFHLDVVCPQRNKEAICFWDSINAKCLGTDLEMKLTKSSYKSLKESKIVIPLSDKYYNAFCKLHDECHTDVYWTGSRILTALDKFNVLIIIEKEDLIGAIVTTKRGTIEEYIFFIETNTKYRKQGYAKSLLQKFINRTFLSDINVINLQVEINNIPAINLYKSFGFREIDCYSTYSIESL